MIYREEILTPSIAEILLRFSSDWAVENSCRGYCANELSDLEGNRVFLAWDEEEAVGYLFGKNYQSSNATSVIPEHTPCFEVDELYVIPSRRSCGIGRGLFTFVQQQVSREAEYITLSTATKNARAILHFYMDELGMEFWSARLFLPLSTGK